jgi:hypothetical protein
MNFDFKKFIKGSLPFVIGLLIGGGLSKNKYIWYILIFFMIFRIVFNIFAGSAQRVKDSTDKKIAMQNEAISGLNKAIDYTEYGHKIGGNIFDKFYSNYIFFLNLAIVTALIIMLAKSIWYWSLVLFIGLNVFIVLNQIVRKVKHLDNSDYEKIDRNKYNKGRKIDED